jgi:hypothetical protein
MNNTRRSQKRKGKGRGRTRGTRDTDVKIRVGQELVNRTMNFMAPRLRTSLVFNKFLNLGLLAGTSFEQIYFQPTFAYDVDPVVGSDAMAGFFELGKLYTKYRVNAYTIVANFCNNEQFAVQAMIMPTNTNGGGAFTPQTILANPRTKRSLVGTYAQFPKKLRDRVTIADFGGSANTKSADTYSALTAGTAAPLNNIFHVVGIWADLGLFNAGVTIDATVTVDIEFFELITPTL